jgi:hypothetical protein
MFMFAIRERARSCETNLPDQTIQLRQAPGSSHLCKSAENPDFGSQKCNKLGVKSAIRYKVHHVVKIITCFLELRN